MTRDSAKEISDRELDTRIAVELFDWEWLERPNIGDQSRFRKAIFPPLESGWIRFNYFAEHWKPAREETERFSDWAECCATEDRSQRGLPYYATDIAAAMQVVEKMREQNWYVEIGNADDEWCVEFRRSDGKDLYTGGASDVSLAKAVCLAALETVDSGS